MFTSALYPKEFVVDDDNAATFCPGPEQRPLIDGERKLCGRIPRDYERQPYGSLPYLKTFDLPLIPRDEWTDRIEEMEKTKTRLSDLWLAQGIKCLDQNGTNYCWANAVVSTILMLRARMGEPYEPLSPASVAAQVKNYRNVGGWGGEALQWIIDHGVASAAVWPPNAINRTYKTPESDADAATRKVTKWLELQSRNFEQLMTCLLNRIPVAVGLNWWSHEVCALDPVVTAPGKFGTRDVNSWGGSYGDHGLFVLAEAKATQDDGVAPLVTMAA